MKGLRVQKVWIKQAHYIYGRNINYGRHEHGPVWCWEFGTKMTAHLFGEDCRELCGGKKKQLRWALNGSVSWLVNKCLVNV